MVVPALAGASGNSAPPTSSVRIGPRHHRFSFMLGPDEKRTAATDPQRVWKRVAP
jgi:hypothetical protein